MTTVFTIGGPIWIPKLYNGRNKSFFFVNFEQFRQNNFTSSGLATVPTTAYRNGDFRTALCNSYTGGGLDGTGGTCSPFNAVTLAGQPTVPATDPGNGTNLVQGTIYDPYSTRLVNGQNTRTPFPNNTIPLSQMDPVAVAIQKLLPAANLPGTTNNFSIPGYTAFQHTTNVSFKFDQNISPTIKVAVYYSQLNTLQPNVNGGISSSVSRRKQHYQIQWKPYDAVQLRSEHSSDAASPCGHFGYWQTTEPHVPPPFDQSTIGLKGYAANQIFPDIAGISGQQGGWGPGFGALGATFTATAYEEKPTANTNLTWIRGNHTFKAGGDYTQEGYPVPSLWRANGNFTFAADQTSDPWQSTQALSAPNPTGFGYASFLTGLPNVLALNQPTESKLGYHSLGLYLQDSWKVTRKLTLDYGLRWDYQTYMTEQYGRTQNASLSTQDVTLGRPARCALTERVCNCQFFS